MRTVRHAFGAAAATLLLGAALFVVGVRPAGLVFVPGFLAAWFGTGTETGGAAAFVGVNAAVWWAAWAVILGVRRRLARPRPGRVS